MNEDFSSIERVPQFQALYSDIRRILDSKCTEFMEATLICLGAQQIIKRMDDFDEDLEMKEAIILLATTKANYLSALVEEYFPEIDFKGD